MKLLVHTMWGLMFLIRSLATDLFCATMRLAADPNVVNVKGTDSILAPAYRQKLSLALGCVGYKLPICENLWRIAYEKDQMAKEVAAGKLLLSINQQQSLVPSPVDDLVE